MARSVTFVVEGPVDTQITVSENLDGTLSFDLSVLGGVIGDLRGLFFDVANPNKLAGLSIEGADVTKHVAGNDQVHTVGKDVNVNGNVASTSGNFDIGIAFGKSGKAADDIQSTSFTVSGLTIDDVSHQDFALRYTSVGFAGGARNDGTKVLGRATAAPNAIADAFSTDEDTPLAANVLGNDTDADGDPLAVNLVNGTAANVGIPVLVTTAGGRIAEITLAEHGTLGFTPGDDFASLGAGETDSFHLTYGVTDNNGGLDTEAAVTVTVSGSDDRVSTVIDFEDLANRNFVPIPDGYHGFNWDVPGDNLYSANGSTHAVVDSGFRHAGSIVAFTPFAAEPVTISRTDGTDFTFDQVQLTSASNSWEMIRVSGYNNGALIGRNDVGITNDGPTKFDPNWGPIDKLEFDLTAWSGAYEGGVTGQHFIIDNFKFFP